MRTGRLIIVVVVFLASLTALAASAGIALRSTTDELAIQDRLREAANELASESQEAVARTPDQAGSILPEPNNRRLADVVRRVLKGHPEFEGGLYFIRSDQFAGAVMLGPEPTPDPTPDDHKAIEGKNGHKKVKKKKAEPKGAAKSGPAAGRRDPPPLETPSIRQQCRAAANSDPQSPPIVEVRDVGPSRVAVATAAVGEERPSRVAVWVMIRLSGPEQQKAHLARLQLSTALSFAGVILALALSIGLIRTLRTEERRRAKLSDELRKSEHLASLGRMLAGVAHEVRNPLTAIHSTVQLWERLPDQARTPESLAAVVGAVNRLNDLVGRLLLFARAGHENRRPVDLNAIVAETLELIRARAEPQGIEIESKLAAGLPLVSGTSQALGQVVLNLVTNALQAMPRGGRLRCWTQLLPGGIVELAVSDTGPGVPEAERDRIFEPFFTTRPDGNGLGLALCREIARQHGGDVVLDRESTTGATFRLTLPTTGEVP